MGTSKYISNLLREHDCVILPGFGGFVANYQSARVHPTRHTITPPDKFVAFNKSLVNNDGLLVNHVARSEGISFAEAEKKVKQFIRECEAALQKEEVVILPEVGKLYQDSDKQVRFVRDQTTNHFLGAYGMDTVQFPPVRREILPKPEPPAPPQTKEKPAEKKTAKAKKERRKKFRVNYYMIIILMLSSALVFQWHMYDMDLDRIKSVRFDDSSIVSYVKGLFEKPETIPTPEKEKVTPELTPEGEEKITNEEDLMGLEPANFDSPEPEVGTAPAEEATPIAEASPTPEPAPEKVETPVATPSSGVYVIIGSFKTQWSAGQMVKRVKTTGLAPIILDNGAGKVRVGVGAYKDRTEASASLPGLRETYPGAWILAN